jgi:hypothetical protein
MNRFHPEEEEATVADDLWYDLDDLEDLEVTTVLASLPLD